MHFDVESALDNLHTLSNREHFTKPPTGLPTRSKNEPLRQSRQGVDRHISNIAERGCSLAAFRLH